MGKRRIVVLGVVTILALPLAAQEKDIEKYIETKRDLPYAEQFDMARAALLNTTETAIRNEAIGDLEKMSLRLGQNGEGQHILERFLLESGETQQSKLYQHAYLARARIMYRSAAPNDRIVGEQLFKDAIRNNYQDAYVYFIDTLDQAGEPERAACEQFNYAVDGNAIPDDWRNFIPQFFEKLMKLKKAKPAVSAVNDVLPQLKLVAGRPEYTQVARSLCLLADTQLDEARAGLDELERTLNTRVNELPQYNELRNIPLYRAAVEVFAQDRPEAVRAALQDFMERNLDRPEFVLRMSLSLAELLGNISDRFGDMLQVTEPLMANGYDREEKYGGKLTDIYWITALQDIHALGLTANGRWREGKAIHKKLVDQYFPHNRVAVHAMFHLGHILWKKERKIDEALQCFTRVIEESNDHQYVRQAKGFCVDIARENAGQRLLKEIDVERFESDLRDSMAPG